MRALVLVMLLAGCGGSKSEEANVDFKSIAEQFAKHLVAHDYAAANAMLGTPVPDLQHHYETMVEPIGKVTGTQVGETMTAWPDKQKTDAGWAYVAITGELGSEAVTVVVTRDKKIRYVEWGRP